MIFVILKSIIKIIKYTLIKTKRQPKTGKQQNSEGLNMKTVLVSYNKSRPH